jgi:hypothetical protein
MQAAHRATVARRNGWEREPRRLKLCLRFQKAMSRKRVSRQISDPQAGADRSGFGICETGGHPNLPLADLKIWQGWKESNLRMPESKSGALTNLATPLHGTIVVANNRPINRLFTYIEKLFNPFPPGKIPNTGFYQPAKGCTSRLLHLRTCQPPGALAKFASCGSCANTALPEPVILP